jgi:hypothetical protein
VKRDHLDSSLSELGVEAIAVVCLVSHHSRRVFGRKHEIEQLLHQAVLRSIRWSRIDRHREPTSIDQDHYFHAVTDLREPNTLPSRLCLAEAPVDEALVQPVPASLLDAPSRFPHERLEYTGLHPPLEPAVHCTLRSKLCRQILPLGAIVEHPEDACNHLPFVNRRATTLWAARRVRHTVTNPIELLSCELKHARYSDIAQNPGPPCTLNPLNLLDFRTATSWPKYGTPPLQPTASLRSGRFAARTFGAPAGPDSPGPSPDPSAFGGACPRARGAPTPTFAEPTS